MSQTAASLPGQSQTEQPVPEFQEFSLVLGGPLYQLFRKAHLADEVQSHLKQRLLIITGLIWLPLLVLCALGGTLVRGVEIPFLYDVETHVRFLVSVPLMIIAELTVHKRMREIVAQFIRRNLVPPASMDRFRAAIASAMVWRNSVAFEIGILALVLTAGYYIRTDLLNLSTSTWYVRVGPTGASLTLPGIWFSFVSNPVMQFLLLRWLYRMVIWARFLWQVSRIDLDLIPTHPDRNAGLGFLSTSAYAYTPLLASFGASVSGILASRIFHEGASHRNFQTDIVTLVILAVILVLGPMAVFAPRIVAAKRKGLADYGALAAEYSRDFRRRWLESGHRDSEKLLGTSDIQSLADMGNAFDVIRGIKPVPFNRDMLVQLVVATLAPVAPLVLTMIPFEELVGRMLKAVF